MISATSRVTGKCTFNFSSLGWSVGGPDCWLPGSDVRWVRHCGEPGPRAREDGAVERTRSLLVEFLVRQPKPVHSDPQCPAWEERSCGPVTEGGAAVGPLSEDWHWALA